ncbi:hypothetical protein GCM10019016_104510 [Streptomyces prasinosporus]|uniref:Uncharacterized protein n=2 Tax=Streptomyces prasinosporus TaxID=68256 RepID=A0ABP6UA44_9ACTN
MYDYFSAASDESAATTIDLPGGPDGAGAQLPMPVPEIVRRYGHDGLRELLRPQLRLAETGFHVVATKGFDSTTDLGAIERILTGVDFDEFLARPRTSHAVAERDGGERLVLTISDELQGVLARAEAAELTAAARRWVEEQGSGDTDVLGGLLHELAELARGAQRRGGTAVLLDLCLICPSSAPPRGTDASACRWDRPSKELPQADSSPITRRGPATPQWGCGLR